MTTYMISWQMQPGRLHEALAIFAQIPADQLAAEPGAAIRMIGRWHDLVRGKGVVICQTDDPAALSQWCLNWNSLLDFEIGIVHDDAETRAIAQARNP